MDAQAQRHLCLKRYRRRFLVLDLKFLMRKCHKAEFKPALSGLCSGLTISIVFGSWIFLFVKAMAVRSFSAPGVTGENAVSGWFHCIRRFLLFKLKRSIIIEFHSGDYRRYCF